VYRSVSRYISVIDAYTHAKAQNKDNRRPPKLKSDLTSTQAAERLPRPTTISTPVAPAFTVSPSLSLPTHI
jgi:hypothetical protein